LRRRNFMGNDIEALRKEVWALFQDMQAVFLATVDQGKPRVRPVMLIHFDRRLWVSTGANDAKIRQMKANNNVEFCLLLKEGENQGTVRGLGVANIVEDMETKKLLSENIPFFKQYWKDHTDPGFALVQIHVEHFEYMLPGAYEAKKFSAK
jgi:uncharacterized pyridoxamine 5'-phosphate oxidase family protein